MNRLNWVPVSFHNFIRQFENFLLCNCKEIKEKIKETKDSQYIYQIRVDKACFQLGKAYGDFKHLARRTASDKIW